MAIYFKTSSELHANRLLALFDYKIYQTEKAGKITTWERVGELYTHKASEWYGKAWFKAIANQSGLNFNIIKSVNFNLDATVYAYYHGHLSETFLSHFNREIHGIGISPRPENGDQV